MKLKLIILGLLLVLMPLVSGWFYAPETAWFHDYGLDFLGEWMSSMNVDCPGEYVCVSEFYSAYLSESCEFKFVQHCVLGCSLGECIGAEPVPEPSCEPGWQCLDDMYLVYNDPNCFPVEKYFCVWGCSNSVCNWGTSFPVE